MLSLNWRRLNNLLLVTIIGVNLYTILLPFWPKLDFYIESKKDTQKTLNRQIHNPPTELNEDTKRIVIPKIMLSEEILEVKSNKTVLDDIWRRPFTSTPDLAGNTVLVGHRFTYKNPSGVFYHLDKLALGDEISVQWQAKNYLYKVSDIKITGPNDTSVEAPSKNPKLTLYTCTPLWNPEKRLVVIANLEKIYD